MYHDMDFKAKPNHLVTFEHTFLRNVLTKSNNYVTYFSVT
jgi:hypothetical protein